MERICCILLALTLTLSVWAQNTEAPEISPNFITFNQDNWTLLSYDRNSGDAVVSYTAEKPNFVPGKTVTTLSNDTIGYFLRKITQVQENGNHLLLKTTRADMEDVFMNKSFTLNTAGVSLRKGVSLRSASDISKALTDDKGHIHPVEYIIRSKDNTGKQQIKKISFVQPEQHITAGGAAAVLDGRAQAAEEVNIINIYENLSDMDLYQSGDFRLFIEEGHLLFKVDAVFDFVFNARDTTGQEIIRDGELREFQFYLQGIAEAKNNYKMTFSAAYSDEDEIELLEDLVDVTVKFMVGPVPVWISFGLDILATYSFSAEAEVVATWGTEAKQTVKIGGKYVTSSGSFSPIAEKEFSYNFEPLIVVGEADVNARAEIFPRASMMIYSAAGPYCDVAPYLSADFKAKAMVSSEGESDLKWTSSLNFGIDFRAGLKPAFLECLFGEIGPYTKELYKYTIWESPCIIDLISKPDNNYILPATLPLTFKISDKLRKRAAFSPLFFEVSHGTLSSPWVIANTSGLATINWTLDDNSKDDRQRLVAKLMDTEDETLSEYELTVHISNSATGIYMENLAPRDSLILNNVSFNDIDRGVFSKSENKADFLLEDVQFKNCDLGISGHYGNVRVEQCLFEQCPTALHVQSKNKESKLYVTNTRFVSCENLAIKFSDFNHSEIRNNQFSACNKAVLGENGSLYSVMESTFTECVNCTEANHFEDTYIYKNNFTGKTLDEGSDQFAILVTNSKNVFFDENQIQNFQTGIYAYNIFNSGNISNQKITPFFNGFELSNVHNVKIFSNSVQFKGNIAMNEMDRYVGIFLRNSDNNQIMRNNISNMCSGIVEHNCNNNHFSANTISASQCDSTGLRSTASKSTFVNNSFTDNRGAALLFDYSLPHKVANNNFINNTIGVGSNNLSNMDNQNGSSEIAIHSNYFEGQSLSNTIGQVKALDNLSKQVSLVCDFPPDTLFVPSGGQDTLMLHVQNFADFSDSVVVNFSDSRGWISNEKIQSRNFADSTGTLFFTVFSASGEDLLRSTYTADLVIAEVLSTKYNMQAKDSVVLAIYGQELTSILIEPEMNTMHWQDSLQFRASAYDQYAWEMTADICWQASAGSIDQNGWLRFDEEFEGQVFVTALDSVSTKSASTQVMVSDVQSYLDSIDIQPGVLEIKAGERIQFSAEGFNQFGYPMTFEPIWSVSSGNISETGWFVAPLKNAQVNISARHRDSGVSRHLSLQVICMQDLYQQAILCGDDDSLYVSDKWIRQAGVYHDTLSDDSCSVHYIIEILKADLPQVILDLPFDSIGQSDGVQVLSGGSPESGIYYINGQEATQFDPETMAIGSHVVQYIYTDELGCSNLAEVELRVLAGEIHIPGTVQDYIRISPNPNRGSFSIDLGSQNSEALEISLYDLAGRTILLPETRYSNSIIVLKELSDGVYFLRIRYNNKTSNHKIIIHAGC